MTCAKPLHCESSKCEVMTYRLGRVNVLHLRLQRGQVIFLVRRRILNNIVLLENKRLWLVLLIEVADYLGYVLDLLLLIKLAYVMGCEVFLHKVLGRGVLINVFHRTMVMHLGFLARLFKPLVRCVEHCEFRADALASRVGADFEGVLRLHGGVAAMELCSLYDCFADCA